jgi:hypothetical protein
MISTSQIQRMVMARQLPGQIGLEGRPRRGCNIRQLTDVFQCNLQHYL